VVEVQRAPVVVGAGGAPPPSPTIAPQTDTSAPLPNVARTNSTEPAPEGSSGPSAPPKLIAVVPPGMNVGAPAQAPTVARTDSSGGAATPTGAANPGLALGASPTTLPTGLGTAPPLTDAGGTTSSTATPTTGLVTNPPANDAANLPTNGTTGLVTQPPVADATTSNQSVVPPGIGQSPAQLGTVPVVNAGYLVWMSPWGAMLFPIAPMPPSR
jgi:hypothetical protein